MSSSSIHHGPDTFGFLGGPGASSPDQERGRRTPGPGRRIAVWTIIGIADLAVLGVIVYGAAGLGGR